MITFEQVTKRFGPGPPAVDELTLECPTGKITVFVGSSGCGKTTSLRMVNRMVEPSSGRILIQGDDTAQLKPVQLRREIGYVIQQIGLFPHRTVLDNVGTVPTLLGWKRARTRARSLELLERVGLSLDVAKRYPSQLSGGQQQRVGVARALAADPPVLLMDEPFSAVDPVVRAELQTELLRLQRELGKTIIFVTHDIDEAIKLGDRIAVFRIGPERGGHLVQYDTPERILAEPVDSFVESFVGLDRGIRRLSFLSGEMLTLRAACAIGVDASSQALAAAVAASGQPWALVVDREQRPQGWVSATEASLRRSSERLAMQPLGHCFRPDRDSVRAALDAAVLSPSGLAVAIDAAGKVRGVVGYEEIASAIRARDQRRGAQSSASPAGAATPQDVWS